MKVLGLIGCVMVVMVLAGCYPSLGQAREKARRINCAGNLKQIGLALIIYAGDDPDDGYFPDGKTFSRLDIGRYLVNGKVYQCPSSTAPNTLATQSNYVYLGSGLKDTNAKLRTVIMAHDKVGNHTNWINCLYLDGHVKGVPTSATTWAQFRTEREAAGDIIVNSPAGQTLTGELPTYQSLLEEDEDQ